MECISIVLICDDNYILPTAVAIASMIENKQAESRYRIHIVASIAALLKFILPELLSEDKVLYLDGDILVKEDLSELFYSDIQEYLAGVIIDSGSIYYKHQ